MPMLSPIRQHAPISFADLVARIEQDDLNKRDQQIKSMNLLRVDDRFRLTSKRNLDEGGPEKHRAYMTDNAMRQICERTKVNTGYAKRIQGENDAPLHDSLAYQMNYFLSKLPAKEGMMRMRVGTNPEGGSGGSHMLVRAVLSEQYGILDNKHVVEVLRQLDGTSMQILPPHLDDDHFHLRVILPDFKYDVKPGMRSVGDIIYGMLHISNSETGAGSTAVDVMAYRLTCTNGMTTSSLIGGYKQMHKGSTEKLFEGMSACINGLGSFIQQVGDRFALAHDVKVEKPIEVLRALLEAALYPEYMVEEAERCFFEEAYDSVFGVANAMTLAAQRFEDPERRMGLERLAGDYMFEQTKALAAH